MAIASAESRLAPLAEAYLEWTPSGLFARLPPAMEMPEEEFAKDALPRFGGHSWSGNAAHQIAVDHSTDGEVSSCAISKKSMQCGDNGESRCSTRGAPSPWTSVFEEGHEYELAQIVPPHEPASIRRIANAGFFMDTPVPAGSAVLLPAAGVTSARAEAAAGPMPPKQAPQIVTTLMVQNLKRTLTRQGFMLSLDELGFADKYDFVHLPKSFGTERNNGFAFVNFKKLEDAEEFARSIARIKGSKMRAVPADVQGLDANAWKADSRRVNRIRNIASRPWVASGRGQDALLHV